MGIKLCSCPKRKIKCNLCFDGNLNKINFPNKFQAP